MKSKTNRTWSRQYNLPRLRSKDHLPAESERERMADRLQVVVLRLEATKKLVGPVLAPLLQEIIDEACGGSARLRGLSQWDSAGQAGTGLGLPRFADAMNEYDVPSSEKARLKLEQAAESHQ